MLLAFVMATGLLSNAIAEDAAPVRSQLTIRADQPQGTINRNIYGQFSEHRGRCICEGIWVGEDSPIPNTRGIRNDVVAALLQVLQNLVNLLGIPSSLNFAVMGAVIFFGVLVDQMLRDRRRLKTT